MLGLSWLAETDCFVFRLKHHDTTSPLSKRTVLSIIAELFDPLGWLAPIIVSAKIFMQSLWLLKLGWDDSLPERESQEWRTFYSGLKDISAFRIPRWLKLQDVPHDYELHGFSDASERAYAAVVYVCVTHPVRSVTLVVAKSKVAPVKQITIPHLELCAAHLLVQLAKHVREVLARSCSVHLWSDSTVTLGWIRGHPVRWKTYVANRVSEIQCLLPDATWRHVASKENPADCASRGLSASELQKHDLWWSGPQWLLASQQEWPQSTSREPEEMPEQRVVSHVIAKILDDPIDLLTRYSSLILLQRITAWCFRFFSNVRLRGDRKFEQRTLSSTLSAAELSASLTRLVKIEQSRVFGVEIAALKSRATIKKGPLLRLNPFLDDNEQLCVGGRLKHAILDADEKHPAILPRDSPLTTLAIDQAHHRMLHGGTR